MPSARRSASSGAASPHIAVAVFGDGATEEGVYHESLNFAALMKVPVLFSARTTALPSTAIARCVRPTALPQHAATVRHRRARLEEGWDMLAVRQATLEAAAKGAGRRAVRAGDRHLALQGACRRGRGFPLQLSHAGRRRRLEEARSPDRRTAKLVEALTARARTRDRAAVAFAEAVPRPAGPSC